MTSAATDAAPADLLLTNGTVHPLDGSAAVEAVAVRDGDIIQRGDTWEVGFREDVDTQVIDLDGRHLLPGFIDAHTHLEVVGRHELEADCSGADTPTACLDRLADARDRRTGWVLGYGYDESRWDGGYLTRDQLDTVSTDRPVVAFREDLHLASVNSVVLDRHAETMPEDDIRTADGEPTGVLVEGALEVIREVTRADPDRMRAYLRAAQATAVERGITAVHEMVRHSEAPRVYRELDQAGELSLRVRLNYWRDHLDAILEAGLRTNHGSDRVQVGGIKSYTDGSIGGRTARLSEPYADTLDNAEHRGDWVVPPAELRELVERVDDAGLQLTVHAIGDAAITATLDAYEAADTRAESRHRIEHAEMLTDDLLDRLDGSGVIVSAQPNFLKWAQADGLYAERLGDRRRRGSNRFGALVDRDLTLAFGSDCMPLDPLFGIAQVVDAPTPAQSLSVTEALKAYTAGGAYAGFDDDRFGTVEVGTSADLVALEQSPWATDDIAEIDVAMTIVGGEIVYDSRDG
ncbi:MAG: putative metal-dependent hydrolase [halophilic archaeon J07HX5]|jgi:Predicted metal-dependent hydrolase with the TIM-barrel fold|nr:MAG: putative metal-dependent hydrolase [halophilic archaeon J07HX5]